MRQGKPLRAEWRLATLSQAPWDLAVIGHIHFPFVISAGNHTLASLAGWLETEGYGLLQAGEFRLLDFATDPVPRIARREAADRPRSRADQ